MNQFFSSRSNLHKNEIKKEKNMTKDRNIKKMSSLEISLWLFFVAFQTIEGIEISCGFGASSNYALWIADERGGLKFPDYNSGKYFTL